MITEGKMQYLYDDKGRRYLDVSTLPCPLCFGGQMRCILRISNCHIEICKEGTACGAFGATDCLSMDAGL